MNNQDFINTLKLKEDNYGTIASVNTKCILIHFDERTRAISIPRGTLHYSNHAFIRKGPIEETLTNEKVIIRKYILANKPKLYVQLLDRIQGKDGKDGKDGKNGVNGKGGKNKEPER